MSDMLNTENSQLQEDIFMWVKKADSVNIFSSSWVNPRTGLEMEWTEYSLKCVKAYKELLMYFDIICR